MTTTALGKTQKAQKALDALEKEEPQTRARLVKVVRDVAAIHKGSSLRKLKDELLAVLKRHVPQAANEEGRS